MNAQARLHMMYEVNMGVDKSREHDAASEVKRIGQRSGERLDLGLISHRKNASRGPIYRQGSGMWFCRAHRVE
jgi:hypothetical protein